MAGDADGVESPERAGMIRLLTVAAAAAIVIVNVAVYAWRPAA